MRSRVFLGALFGAIGGFAGFALQEALITHDPVLPPTAPDMMRLGLFVGIMLGIAIGAVEGAVLGSPNVLLKGTLLGAVIGGAGGILGMYMGGIAYAAALFGKDPTLLEHSSSILDFTHAVLARALGWTFLGALPGLAVGGSTMSRRRALHGLAGGLLGGFIGGFAFNLVANLIAQPIQGMAAAATEGPRIVEIGGPSRAVGFTTIGAMTGLFVGLVEEWLKQAWVRVLAGRNEGRDHILSKDLSILGRDERADVPLFGDPAIAAQHCAIRRGLGRQDRQEVDGCLGGLGRLAKLIWPEGSRHYLLDGGTPVGSVVNGQRVQQSQPHLLKDGDMLQLGQVRLLFREKATASKIAHPQRDATRAAPATSAVSVPSHLCPFCGAAKDPQGACLCSVGAQAPTPPAVPGVYGPPAMAPGAGVAAPNAPPRLTGIEGPCTGLTIELAAPVITLGREPDRDVSLSRDTAVSRRHAHVAFENGLHVLYDDGSSNGTYVNGVRITAQPLARGDVLQLGQSKFLYE